MGGDVEDLRTDLLFMRKGAGFTPERITSAGTLTFLLGSKSEPFDNLRERFVSAIQSLRDPELDLLMNAYRLTPETAGLTTLRQRRAHYGQTIQRSIDTVADREDAALTHLASQLLTGWYPASPLTVRVPELHNGIINEAVSIVTVINDGQWQETREHYRFFAAFDEAEYLTISTNQPGTVTPEGDFTVRTRHIGNSHSHHFWHKTPMRRGNTYDLRYRLVPDPQENDTNPLVEASRAFHERTLTARFEVVFIGKKPERIWSFERLTHLERPGRPSPDRLLTLGDASSARVTWRDLYGGLFSGMAWVW